MMGECCLVTPRSRKSSERPRGTRNLLGFETTHGTKGNHRGCPSHMYFRHCPTVISFCSVHAVIMAEARYPYEKKDLLPPDLWQCIAFSRSDGAQLRAGCGAKRSSYISNWPDRHRCELRAS